jgi:hypothetical protein
VRLFLMIGVTSGSKLQFVYWRRRVEKLHLPAAANNSRLPLENIVIGEVPLPLLNFT